MKSLAEHLGVAPLRPEPEREDFVYDENMTVEQFCLGVLQSRTYRASLLRRIEIDDLPPAVELMMWDRAHGCRTKNLKIEHSERPYQGWDDAALAERELALVRHLRQLRMNGTGSASSDDEDAEPPSVH